MAKPISPDEVVKTLPDEVIISFNELISEKLVRGTAQFTQKEAIARILTKMDTTRQEIFNKGWLDIEDVYNAVGWKVAYDSPAYDESYEAHFTFRKKNK
jgi:hypothetical protein